MTDRSEWPVEHPYATVVIDPDDGDALRAAALARARDRGCRCPSPDIVTFADDRNPMFVRSHVMHGPWCPLGDATAHGIGDLLRYEWAHR